MVTIKIASIMTGLTVKSIRFYEDIGLYKPSARSAGGYRLYSEDAIKKLQQIRLYRDLKFPLKTITLLMNQSETEKHKIFQMQLDFVNQKRKDYERVAKILETSIAMGQKSETTPKNNQPTKVNTAIIGIDLQNEMLPGGALPCKRILTLIKPLSNLFNTARSLEIPIIYVCDNHRQGVDEELEIWGDHCIEGTWGAEIIEQLSPAPHDFIVKKGYFNGFIGTELQDVLDGLNVGRLIFVGWRTHVCIALTAIEAFHRGYEVVIARDGVNSNTKIEHQFGLRMLKVNYGFKMYSCAQVLSEMAK